MSLEPSAARDLAAIIRRRVPDWTEVTEPGLWWWRDPESEDGDYAREVIIEGRTRRVRPISERHVQGWAFGPTVEGFADGIAFRLDLPGMTDRSDLRRVLDVLTTLGVLPPD